MKLFMKITLIVIIPITVLIGIQGVYMTANVSWVYASAINYAVCGIIYDVLLLIQLKNWGKK